MIERGQPRTLLEKIIRESEYTNEEWRDRFDVMASEMNENATLSVRQLQRWMAGEVDDARPSSRRVAAQLWGYPFPTLLAPPGVMVLPAPPVASGTVLSAPPGASGSMASGSVDAETTILEEVTIMAAHESSRHAAESDGGVSPAIIEQVQAEVWRLARNYATMPPLRLLAESRQARNLAYMALDRTKRPAQTKDLYLAAGQLCGLMAVASFDLAVWDAASEQARAAHVYAELVDHPGLRTWARGTQALIAYWTGRPRDRQSSTSRRDSTGRLSVPPRHACARSRLGHGRTSVATPAARQRHFGPPTRRTPPIEAGMISTTRSVASSDGDRRVTPPAREPHCSPSGTRVAPCNGHARLSTC
jgi:hypothetical protein